MRRTKSQTTQDVIGATDITQDGLIKSGNTYRIVIEVEPKNLDTVSEMGAKKCLDKLFLTYQHVNNRVYTADSAENFRSQRLCEGSRKQVAISRISK